MDVALHEVGRIHDQPQVIGPDRLDDVDAPPRDVAENVLLVLVQRHDIVFLGDPGDRRHATDHLVAMSVGVVALIDEEREHAHVPRPEAVGQPGGMAHALEVWLEIARDRDLADGRPDARHGDTGGSEHRRRVCQLCLAEVEDVRPPGAAELEVPEAEIVQQRHLLGEVGRRLVGEPGERPGHRICPIVGLP
ncbi:MAG: hypothetical protein R2713_07960 [Ilumatobacteraceae bacterium]